MIFLQKDFSTPELSYIRHIDHIAFMTVQKTAIQLPFQYFQLLIAQIFLLLEHNTGLMKPAFQKENILQRDRDMAALIVNQKFSFSFRLLSQNLFQITLQLLLIHRFFQESA